MEQVVEVLGYGVRLDATVSSFLPKQHTAGMENCILTREEVACSCHTTD